MAHRDVLMVPLPDGSHLALTCDVAGGVGPKPMDAVAASGETVGRFTARVALLELVAVGAEPLALVDGIAMEPGPTSQAILDGIRAELIAAGIPDLPVTGSMEKNLPTTMTAVTVTAAGLVHSGPAKTGRAGDRLVVIGVPKVGGEVRLDDPALADVPAARALLGHPAVHALIPAGSGGVLPECAVLAAEAGCGFRLDEPDAPSLRKSAGPATCLVAAVDPAAVAALAQLVRQPVWAVGWLV